MSLMPPLIDSSSSERARELLRAARADRPRASAAQRTLAALGVAGTAATATGAALAASGAQASAGSALGAVSLPMLAAKWVLVGTLGGLALASSATLTFSSHEVAPSAQAPAAPPRAASEPAAALNPQPLPPSAPPTVEPATEPGQPTEIAAPTLLPAGNGVSGSKQAEPPPAPLAAPADATFEPPEQSQLLRDIALLDDARRALKAGNGAQALALVARYEAERHSHVLDREAELLRQRALAASRK